MIKLILSAGFIIAGLTSYSQIDVNGGPINVPTEGVIDGVVIVEHIPTKRMIPYEHVREADMIWSKRVWRAIDTREKINHTLYLPFDEFSTDGLTWTRNSSRWSLWTVIRTNILNGNLQVYYPMNPEQQLILDGDQFKYSAPLPTPGVKFEEDVLFRNEMVERQVLGVTVSGPRMEIASKVPPYEDSIIVMPDGTQVVQFEPRKVNWYTSKEIIQYRLKEDWFFDKERSVLDVRILGIAPVVYNRNETGQIEKMREIFWLYFPQCRFAFNNYFAYNPKNDSQWMSFDDLFWKRQFNSTIIKQSNTFDRKIESYRTGVDALMESDKITEQIRTLEHDVWHF
ncbi:MAG: gliding motility protein GldN [Crocinitomicaceae bacterium]|nr:gliding motility protein GldN [Crocinitomicaceae bacterium]